MAFFEVDERGKRLWSRRLRLKPLNFPSFHSGHTQGSALVFSLVFLFLCTPLFSVMEDGWELGGTAGLDVAGGCDWLGA